MQLLIVATPAETNPFSASFLARCITTTTRLRKSIYAFVQFRNCDPVTPDVGKLRFRNGFRRSNSTFVEAGARSTPTMPLPDGVTPVREGSDRSPSTPLYVLGLLNFFIG